MVEIPIESILVFLGIAFLTKWSVIPVLAG